jgi:hypothetical protein
VETHVCEGKNIGQVNVKEDHRKLTSKFVAYRLCNTTKTLPTFMVKGFIDMVKALFGYTVKYGKAWKAKQATFKMLYGDWDEA